MDTPAPSQADAAVLRRERDLYLRLLDLGHEVTLAPFLKEHREELRCDDGSV